MYNITVDYYNLIGSLELVTIINLAEQTEMVAVKQSTAEVEANCDHHWCKLRLLL